MYWNPFHVSPFAGPFAKWKDPGSDDIHQLGLLVMTNDVGRWFMIDCSIRADTGGNTFSVHEWETGEVRDVSLISDRLRFVFTAKTTGNHVFSISHTGEWVFTTCRVLTPKAPID
jgi:hypothetical protein